jgi:DNA-binding CsgD family transcriptional regulator
MGDLEPAGEDHEIYLTPHRRDMLIRLFAGETPHEIACALGRSTSTVTNTIATIRRRLGVRRDVDALREALRRGIVTLEEIERRIDQGAKQPVKGRPAADARRDRTTTIREAWSPDDIMVNKYHNK